MTRIAKFGLFIVVILLLYAHPAQAAVFKIGIMEDKPGADKEYKPLVDFFKSKGIEVVLQGFRYYPDAAIKFEQGGVDAMFSGSGVAGVMMIKHIAYPLLRPVNKEGWSTYWAVVLAPKGSAKYSGDMAYFDNKRIMCSSLASSGEFYARSILGKDRELSKAGSHGIAIEGLAHGMADVVIVKNRVWDSVKNKYPDLEQVGQDNGENPDNTLIVSYKTDQQLVEQVKNVLLNLENDTSQEALAVCQSLKVVKYIQTTEADFSHTLELLSKAGVTKDFNFSF